jgi:hypothetical protein
MSSELEKIDIIRSRFKVGYEEAKDTLKAAAGNVVGALAVLEKRPVNRTDLLALGAEIADEVQKLVGGGPIRRLRVKYGNKLLTETPVALTAAAALAVGVAAVLITKLIIEVDKDEEEAAK